MRSTKHTIAVVLATACASLLLAGCTAGPSAEPDKEIASINTPAPEETAGTDSLFEKYGEPIRLRLDMTDDEQVAAYGAFDACIENNGGSQKSKQDSDSETSAGRVDESAEALCAPLSPMPPWEIDRSNPDALAFVQGVVDCLKGKGVSKVEIAPDDGDGQVNIAFGGKDNDSRSISLGLQYTPECQRTVSAATR